MFRKSYAPSILTTSINPTSLSQWVTPMIHSQSDIARSLPSANYNVTIQVSVALFVSIVGALHVKRCIAQEHTVKKPGAAEDLEVTVKMDNDKMVKHQDRYEDEAKS